MQANVTWLTIAQAAEITGVSTSTVRRWIARGELRAFKFGPRAVRIDPDDLNAVKQQVNPVTFEHQNSGVRS